MRGFLGVSVAPHAAEHLRRPVRQALSCLGDGETAVERVGQSEDGWVAFAGGTADDLIADEGRFTVRLSRALRTAENDLSTADLAALIADDSGLTAIVPPFAAAHRDGPGAPLVVSGDWLGFRQLYRWRGGGVPSLDDAVEEMAEILGRWQTSYLEQHPDAVLQLTGGHDSRILLGAIPDKLRAGLRALTLGDPTSPDVVIAAKLSARYGLRHQVYRMDKQRWPSPAEAHEQVLAAARALECLASPLALAPLLLAESHLEQGYRLSGLGGEVARGFYYAGQPTGAVTSPRLVERLAHWRLFSNEAVEPAALDQAFLAQARETTLATLRGLFAAGDWLRVTDEFYLYHRMHRWAGVHGTVAAVRRHSINPMFGRRFIELALAVAPADKRDSLLLGRLMSRLDPELARLPLDTGLVPARLGRRTVATRLAIGAMTARKAARKVRQRLHNARKAQLGAAGAAALVLAHWRAEPQACQLLYDVPVLSPQWLDGLLDGSHSAEPTTVAFLVNLLAASQQPNSGTGTE